MNKSYNPQAIEQHWYQIWEQEGYFAPQGGNTPYCIMIPPPNVTGHLHMGHAFQDTIMDALVRYHRMRRDNTLWQVGTDHAGIATQMVVEHQLNSERKTRHELGREAFIQRVWEWKAQSGGTITRQLRRMGASVDWTRERFTMDEGLSHAVGEVFVRLYEEGLIYRGQRLVNWDPVLHTAISDLEVISEEENSHLWHMRYPLADGSGYLVVATTRPETMLGDTAVAVHPEDSRYQQLIGKEIKLPLTDRHIPIIADDYVDPTFGSGCVKITPAHDFNDYEVWQRHQHELANQPQKGLINIFTIDARIKASERDDFTFGHRAAGNDTQLADGEGLVGAPTYQLIPQRYRGLDRFEARQHIVADLEEAGLIEKTEDHKLMVPRGDRSRTVIEPYLTAQWFVKATPLAEPAIQAVKKGQIHFVPENWRKIYFEWMHNIQDWCISRQIWWGHRIPAWYDPEGQIHVASTEAQARQKYGLASDLPLEQDPDVLDTWFSSALWPFSTLGWPEETAELQAFYPTSVLVTGFDIIFFWVARMIMMGLKFTGEVPFHEVYIHGLIRDAEGQKMSKSKGNVLDPLDLIDGIDLESLVAKRTRGLMQPAMAKRIENSTRKEFPQGIPAFGCDALRFTFAVLATRGRDIRFDMGRIEGYRNFCNKLWNAARYVLMNLSSAEGESTLDKGEITWGPAERWILSRLQTTTQQVIASIADYRFDRAAQAIYDFTWNEYCDWYLEFSKPLLNNPASSEAAKQGTRQILASVLESLLRLAHPIIPFITEEIWQQVAPFVGRQGKTIMLQPYPQPEADKIDPDAVAEIEWVMALVTGVRSIRSQMNIAPSKPVPLWLQAGSRHDQEWLTRNQSFLTTLAKLESIQWLNNKTPPPAATALVGELKLLIPLAGLIDKKAELQRLDREIQKMRKDLERMQAKLANTNYIERAPEEIVAKERQRAEKVTAALNTLEQQHAEIATL